MTGDPLNVGIVWDAENRLTEVKQGATTLAAFVYDGLGRRQQKVAGGATHTYVLDRDSLVEERLASGQTLRYVEGPSIDQHLAKVDGGAVTYYVADHLGSVVQESSASGTVLPRTYDPWGNLLSGVSAAGWAFTGRQWDPETGLADYRARHYDPRIGRFISEDPVGLRGGDTNFYAYVFEDPIQGRDPSGMFTEDTFPPPADLCKKYGNCGPPQSIPPINMSCLQAAENVSNLLRQVTAGAVNDHHGHCLSHCWMTRACPGGNEASLPIGYAWEIAQICMHKGKGRIQPGDICANETGRNCAAKTCEECCRETHKTCPADQPGNSGY